MAAPTYYKHTDPGISSNWPSARFETPSSSNKSTYYSIYEALKACLVVGYAGKPAAGWAMLFDEIATGTGYRYAITNAAGSGILLCRPSGYPAVDAYFRVQVIICESLPDLDTPIGLVSQSWVPDAGLTGNGHVWAFHYQAATGPQTPTFDIIANENFCVFNMASDQYRLTEVINRPEYNVTVMFGAAIGPSVLGTMAAPALGNFIVAGGWGNAPFEPGYTGSIHRFLYYSNNGQAFSSLRNPTGAAHTEPPLFFNVAGIAGLTAAASGTDTIIISGLTRAYLGPSTGNNNARPIYSTPLYIDIYNHTNTRLLELVRGFGGDLYQPVIINGKEYVLLNNTANTAGILISLDIQDWT